MNRQPVYLSRTTSGVPGLFTKGYLAFQLTLEQYERAKVDRAWIKRYAEDLGFEYRMA